MQAFEFDYQLAKKIKKTIKNIIIVILNRCFVAASGSVVILFCTFEDAMEALTNRRSMYFKYISIALA